MKKLVLLLPFLFFSCAILMAQDDELPPPSPHPKPDTFNLPDQPGFSGFTTPRKTQLSDYLIEPDIIVSFSQGAYNLGVSPYLGHRVWKNLYAGGGLTYMYSGFKNIGYQDVTGLTHYTNASWNTFGGGAYLQYNIWRGFFVRSRFELMHRWIEDVYNPDLTLNSQTNTYNVTLPKFQTTIPDLPLSAGYNLLQNRNFFLPVMFSYNVLYPVTDKLYTMYPQGWFVQMAFIQIF